MSFIKEFLKLTRFEHAIMLAFAVLLSEVIVLGSFPSFSTIIILSLLVPIFSEMGSFALNDYLDVDADKLNKRMDRPLVKGTIDPKLAFYSSWVFFFLSVALSYFINFYAFLIALVFNLLAIAYNYKLKDLPLLGNIYIALSMSIPLIFGNLVVSEILNEFILLLSLLGFFSGVGREIIKSVQDMDGDKRARNSKTYPIIVGEKNAMFTAGFLYLIFTLLTLYLFTIVQNIITQLILVLIILFFSYQVLTIFMKKYTKRFLEKSRKFSLIALFLGMISILIEVLF